LATRVSAIAPVIPLSHFHGLNPREHPTVRNASEE